MRRVFVLIPFLFLISSVCSGQENINTGSRILFQGIVLDAGTMLPVSQSQIVINKRFSSVSGEKGTFAFYVNRTDTVIFSSLGYKSTILYISDTLSGKEFVAGVYMHSDTLSIGEVVIVPRFRNLKSDIMNSRSKTTTDMENAKYNVAVSAYQGRMGQNKLGDPSSNYEMLRQKQKVDAYERGGIPSDKIAGISPLLLIPAAYMLFKGFPDKPVLVKDEITDQEIDQIHRKYLETLKKR